MGLKIGYIGQRFGIAPILGISKVFNTFGIGIGYDLVLGVLARYYNTKDKILDSVNVSL